MSNWKKFSTTVTGTTVPYNPNDQSHAITSVQAGFKKLEWLRICRIPLSFISSKGAFPGHYWIEIINGDENNIDAHIKKARSENQTEQEIIKLGNVQSANGFRESYGWYPTEFPSPHYDRVVIFLVSPLIKKIIYNDTKTVYEVKEKGIVNGASHSRIAEDANEYRDHTTNRKAGRNTMENNLSKYAFDPDQYLRFSKEEKINIVSYPYLASDDNRTKEDIINDIRDFAKTFHTKHSAIWSWNNDKFNEVNCHTFLFLLLGELKLADVIIRDNKDIHFTKYLAALEKSKKADKTRKDLLTNLKNLSLKIPRGYY